MTDTEKSEYNVYVVNNKTSPETWMNVGKAFHVSSFGNEEIQIKLDPLFEAIGGEIILSNRDTQKITDLNQLIAPNCEAPKLKLVKG